MEPFFEDLVNAGVSSSNDLAGLDGSSLMEYRRERHGFQIGALR